jgi:protoporphyrin/coproporphyrin ferrochelatase
MCLGEYRMAFNIEPSFSHGQAPRVAVLLCNLGTPEAPTAPALRRYLAEFLSDHRVVEIPRLVWWLILHGVILRLRPAKSAAKYASVWMPEGSPLRVWSQRQADALQQQLDRAGHHITVRLAMRYGQPSMAQALSALKAEGHTRILIVPAYPQYSGTTTASVFDAVAQWGQHTRVLPEFRFVNRYHDHPGYIAALAASVRRQWDAQGEPERLVMSFHGVPARTLALGDSYHCECHKTGRLLAQALGLPRERWMVTFQSRFGKAKWLEPYTEPTLIRLASEGIRAVDVICPGFTSDCLETLEEIGQEARHAFEAAGGSQFRYLACLNDDAAWISALADLTATHVQGWPTQTPPDAVALETSRARAQAMGARQ